MNATLDCIEHEAPAKTRAKKVTLLDLAQHLESGPLLHEQFNFMRYNSGIRVSPSRVPNCGRVGCALGEMPALDPDWTFNIDRIVRFAGLYFGVSLDIALMLFGLDWPYAEWNPPEWHKPMDKLTPQDVAASIRRYLDWRLR